MINNIAMQLWMLYTNIVNIENEVDSCHAAIVLPGYE